MLSNNSNIHPRILERLLANRSQKEERLAAELKTSTAIAIAEIEKVIRDLAKISDAPGFACVATLIPHCEAALIKLQSIDPAALPGSDVISQLIAQLELVDVALSDKVCCSRKGSSMNSSDAQLRQSMNGRNTQPRVDIQERTGLEN